MIDAESQCLRNLQEAEENRKWRESYPAFSTWCEEWLREQDAALLGY